MAGVGQRAVEIVRDVLHRLLQLAKEPGVVGRAMSSRLRGLLGEGDQAFRLRDGRPCFVAELAQFFARAAENGGCPRRWNAGSWSLALVRRIRCRERNAAGG